MQSKIEAVFLGFAAFLLSYSLDRTSELWYCMVIGFSVFVYYVFPRTPKSIWIYIGLAIIFFIILRLNHYEIPLLVLFPLLLLSIFYPWLRSIPSIKTPIIALSWTLIMISAWNETGGSLWILKAAVLFLLFMVLAISSDVKDRHVDSPSLGTLPQIIPWSVLRWMLLGVVFLLGALTQLWVPHWSLGMAFFGLFSSFMLFRNWKHPLRLPLDPGLLLFALGNLLDQP